MIGARTLPRSTALRSRARGSSLLDGIAAYFPLDEVSGLRRDLVGSAVLSDNNTVASTAKGVGPANLPLIVADFVAANSEYLSSPNFSAVDGISISGWIRTAVASTGLVKVGFSLTDDNRLNCTAWVGAAAIIRSTVGNNSTNISTGGTPTLTPGVWQHFVITYSSVDGVLRAYGNGVAGGTATGLIGTHTSGPCMVLLGVPMVGMGYYTGAMSSVGLWTRPISLAEVVKLYNAGAGNPYPFVSA